MNFDFSDICFIRSETTKNGLEYWKFSLGTEENDERYFLDFYFDKETLCFLGNEKSRGLYIASKKDFKNLSLFKEGREIIEQMEILVNEAKKLKEKENFRFSIISEEQLDEKTFIINVSIDNSPLISQCYYNTGINNFSTTFYLQSEYKQTCFLCLSGYERIFIDTPAFQHIRKHSKQRLRMLTKNAN